MFRYVVVIGLLALSHLTFADVKNDNNNHKSFDWREEERKVMADCMKEVGAVIEELRFDPHHDDINKTYDGKRGAYSFCAAKKYRAVNEEGIFDMDQMKKHEQDNGFFDQTFFDMKYNCSKLRGETPLETYRKSGICILIVSRQQDEEALRRKYGDKPKND